MTRRPPTPLRPLFTFATTLAFAGAVAGACHPAQELDGLAVVSFGPLNVTDASGRLVVDAGPPDVALRGVAAAAGRIVVQTVDHALFVTELRSGDPPTWRPLPVELPIGQIPTGLDLSPDGTTVAVVLGGPETPDLSILLVDVATGEAGTHDVSLAANGPPSWLGDGLIALEVIRDDGHSGIATFDVITADLVVTDAQGFGLSATSAGDRVVLVDPETGDLVAADVAAWLGGGQAEPIGVAVPAGATLLEVALDAEGTRLAVAYLDESGAASTVDLFRHDGGGSWAATTSSAIAGDAAVGLDWLD